MDDDIAGRGLGRRRCSTGVCDDDDDRNGLRRRKCVGPIQRLRNFLSTCTNPPNGTNSSTLHPAWQKFLGFSFRYVEAYLGYFDILLVILFSIWTKGLMSKNSSNSIHYCHVFVLECKCFHLCNILIITAFRQVPFGFISLKQKQGHTQVLSFKILSRA